MQCETFRRPRKAISQFLELKTHIRRRRPELWTQPPQAFLLNVRKTLAHLKSYLFVKGFKRFSVAVVWKCDSHFELMIVTVLQRQQLKSSLYFQIDLLLKSIVSVYKGIKSIISNHHRDSKWRNMHSNSKSWLKTSYKYLLCDTDLFLSSSSGQLFSR